LNRRADVFYQFNENYAPYAGASVASLFINNTHLDSICVYLMVEDVSRENIEKFHDLARQYGRDVVIVNTESLVEMMKKLGMPRYRGSYAANMRLFFPWAMECGGIERLIYIDSDTVVCGPLDELLDIDMGDCPLGMACDSVTLGYRKRIGLSESDPYFNSGVVLFDVARWIAQKGSERIVEHVRNVRSTYVSPDQDLLNVVMKGHIFKLPMRFNVQPIHLKYSAALYERVFRQKNYYDTAEIESAVQNPAIVHFFRFAGEFPWNAGTQHPCREIFDAYLAKSPWRGLERKKADFRLVLRIERCMYRFIPMPIMLRLFLYAHEAELLRLDAEILRG